VPTVVGALVCGVQIYRCGRLVLDQRRFRLPMQVLRHLACDIDARPAVTLTLDFNDYHQVKFCTASVKNGVVTASTYEFPWYTVEGPLLDGTRFRLATAILVKRKERSRRKGNKIKEEIGECVSLTLRLKDPVPGLERWPDLVRAAPLRPNLRLHKVHHEAGRLTVQAVTPRGLRVRNKGSVLTGGDIEKQFVDHHAPLTVFLASYQALANCRAPQRGA